MMTLKNIFWDSPLNLYKDYYLGKYLVSSIRCSYKMGLVDDQIANSKRDPESCGLSCTNENIGPRSIGSAAIMTVASPFMLLYHLFTPAEHLERLSVDNDVRAAVYPKVRNGY